MRDGGKTMTHVPEYYVGIGASAGGLEALEQRFSILITRNFEEQ